MPPGATRRHRLVHLPRPARHHRAIKVSTVPFRAVTTVTNLRSVRLAARSRHQVPYQWRTTTGFLALTQILMDLKSHNIPKYRTFMVL